MSQTLIISAGMPRAGSGWYYNLIHDLVVASGGQNSRKIRTQYHLQSLLTEVNCNISTLNPFRLIPVLLPARLGNKYTIKTHAGPAYLTHSFLRLKWISTVYIYRDPRAALLSAYEYGQRASAQKRMNAFSHLTTLESAAKFMNFYVDIWNAWSKIENVLIVRYEDLLTNFRTEAERLVKHLNLEIEKELADQVFAQYQPGKGDPDQIGTHFSQGVAERFRREFSHEQLEKFSDMFEPSLLHMGYRK